MAMMVPKESKASKDNKVCRVKTEPMESMEPTD
jgi:hypothetical protein